MGPELEATAGDLLGIDVAVNHQTRRQQLGGDYKILQVEGETWVQSRS
jgi:hypothetical protein